MWPAPKFLRSYYRCIQTFWRRVAAKHLRDRCLSFSGYLLPPHPSAHLQRQQSVRSVRVVRGMHLSNSSSLTSMPPIETFTVSSPNGTWRLCSQRACCEHRNSHSAKGHRSRGHPSVPWPLEVPWMMWIWTCPDLPLASSRRNL